MRVSLALVVGQREPTLFSFLCPRLLAAAPQCDNGLVGDGASASLDLSVTQATRHFWPKTPVSLCLQVAGQQRRAHSTLFALLRRSSSKAKKRPPQLQAQPQAKPLLPWLLLLLQQRKVGARNFALTTCTCRRVVLFAPASLQTDCRRRACFCAGGLFALVGAWRSALTSAD